MPQDTTTNPRPSPAGRSLAGRRRRPRSRYAGQLQEKQLLKSMYNIREEQLKKYYKQARRTGGPTGPNLIVLLERRLDNAVFRSGFAQTRRQARQMTTHGFFTVNNRPVDIPSYAIKPGDIVGIRPGKREASYFSAFEKRMQNIRLPSWILLSPKEYSFSIASLPAHDEANVGADVRAVVEYFAR